MTNSEPKYWARAVEWSEEHITRCCCGGQGFLYADVPQTDILYGKAIPCVCQRSDMTRRAAQRLRQLSGLKDWQLQKMTFDSFRPEICQPPESREFMKKAKGFLERYAEKPDGWIILIGAYGSGKTHLATAVARVQLDKGQSVYANTMPGLFDMLRGGYSKDGVVSFEERFDALRKVELLIIDDLGAHRATDWTEEKLFQIIDERYLMRMPLLVTSNEDLLNSTQIDARVRSRLSDGAETENGLTRILRIPCADLRPKREQ